VIGEHSGRGLVVLPGLFNTKLPLHMLSAPASRKDFPALSEHSLLRYFSFIALYVAQGIPEGMCFLGIPAWMAMNGKTPGEISSFVAMVALPWSLKIVVAPMMDRFSYLPMGRRRPWVLFGQLGLMASFIGMAFVPDPLNHLNQLMVAGFCVGFFGAFQDVATDGMAIDIIPVSQQARANGLMWGSKIMGTSASLAIGSWLLNRHGFTASILMLSVFVCLIMLVPLCFRERPGEKLLPWSHGEASKLTQKMQVNSWSAIGKAVYKVFTLKNSLLFAVVAFLVTGACHYMDTIMSIFTVQGLGWTDQVYSRIYAGATLVGGIGGMLIGGFLIDRFGKIRMLNIYFFMLVMLVITFVSMHAFWIHTWFIVAFMVLYQLLYVFSSIGVFAIAMSCCWKKVSATQFTLYMTIANLGRSVGARMIGPVKANFNWEYTLFAFVLVTISAWVVLQFTYVHNHERRVAEIEEADLKEDLVLLPGTM